MKRTDEERRVGDLETVAVWASFLLILYFIFKKELLLYPALLVLLGGVFFKRFISSLVRRWLSFSSVISQVNSRVALSIVFFLFLTPLALLYRLFVKDPLRLKKGTNVSSYFQTRNYSFIKKDFEKPW